MDPGALIADLDDAQRRAVTTESRLVAVVAGAGSGKTRVLTRRVAYRVATETADEAHTLVLTFTREAAGELRRRLPQLGLVGRVTVGTFHSVAHGVLQQRWRDLDQRPRTLVADRRRLLSEVIADRSFGARTVDVDALVDEMNWATARWLSPSGYEAAVMAGERRPPIDTAIVARALDAYRTVKHDRGVVDLDDLLGLTVDAIERDDSFTDSLRWRFRHVLVDEAQDLNPLQHRLIDALRAGRDDVYLVGDPAQAIYGFNGSDPALLVEVADRFPGVEIIRLPSNYRSTAQVVEAGAHALRNDDQTADIESVRGDGAIVQIVEFADEDAEVAGIARSIRVVDPSLVRRNQVAILARTNAQLPPMRAALDAAGVAVRDDPTGTGSALQPLIAQVYRLGDGHQLRRWAQDALEGTDPDAGLADRGPEQEVGRAVLDFLRSNPTGDGAGFRAWVDSTDPFGRAVAGVELLTFHGSKGREWNTVYLIGCETSLMPHRSATTLAAKSEETRLLYVAMTRATDQLVVSWAQRRGGYQRRLTPLLDGFVSATPPRARPPAELLGKPRPNGQSLRAALDAWRSQAARVRGLLPEGVCSDAALAAIARHRPSSADELDRITGLGAITSRRLYDDIAAVLSEARLSDDLLNATSQRERADQPARSTITGA